MVALGVSSNPSSALRKVVISIPPGDTFAYALVEQDDCPWI